MTDILLIEDDLSFVRIVSRFLTDRGYSIDTRHNLREARKAVAENSYRMALLDYHLPDGNGLEWLDEIKTMGIQLPVVIMTSFNDIRTAVKAMREGVIDYITKPVNPEELLMRVNDTLAQDNNKNNAPTEYPAQEKMISGSGPAARQIQKDIALLAPTNMSVLIQGESGTGKENIARTIHRLSNRSAAPFVAIDCGALPDELANSELFGHAKGAFTGAIADKTGHFEEANGGTLFLDEVGNLSYAIQVKLLRAIQERIIQPLGSNKQVSVDVRIITATNDELQHKVADGSFRKDLYHRLNEFTMHVPALRNRLEDMDEFIAFFVDNSNKELGKNVQGFTLAALEVMKAYDWPGNLREMRNVIKRSVLLCKNDWIGKDVLPKEMVMKVTDVSAQPQHDLKAMNEANERELIIKTLKQVKYNKSRAALLLNIDRKTLYLKLARYGIEQ